MPMVFKSKTLTVSIECSPATVYEFVLNPENLPCWAGAFCRSVQKLDDEWIVETPDGDVAIEFIARNELGVLDHRVRLPQGVEVLVPMRVIANGAGSEVIFTLFQAPGMSDEKFAEDGDWVDRDLQSLKRLMENQARGA